MMLTVSSRHFECSGFSCSAGACDIMEDLTVTARLLLTVAAASTTV